MDQCKHCTARGDIAACKEAECSYHGLWLVQELNAEVERLKAVSREYIAQTDPAICCPYHAEDAPGHEHPCGRCNACLSEEVERLKAALEEVAAFSAEDFAMMGAFGFQRLVTLAREVLGKS